MLEIRSITRDDPLYRQEVVLRESVLLGPIGLDLPKFAALFPGVEERFEHFVAVFDHPAGPRVIGCALLLADHPRPGVGKLMQMAVDPQRQGEGVGTRLVVAVERRAFGELGLAALYCHARDTAYGFYSSLGWEFDSETFDEAGVPHRRMIVLGDEAGGARGDGGGDED
jgi:N-acetylglutamate synthase-like GNAT family acetyltransferase